MIHASANEFIENFPKELVYRLQYYNINIKIIDSISPARYELIMDLFHSHNMGRRLQFHHLIQARETNPELFKYLKRKIRDGETMNIYHNQLSAILIKFNRIYLVKLVLKFLSGDRYKPIHTKILAGCFTSSKIVNYLMRHDMMTATIANRALIKVRRKNFYLLRINETLDFMISYASCISNCTIIDYIYEQSEDKLIDLFARGIIQARFVIRSMSRQVLPRLAKYSKRFDQNDYICIIELCSNALVIEFLEALEIHNPIIVNDFLTLMKQYGSKGSRRYVRHKSVLKYIW